MSQVAPGKSGIPSFTGKDRGDLRSCSFESSQRCQGRARWAYWQVWEPDQLASVSKENNSNPHHLNHYHQVREVSGHFSQRGLIFKTNTMNI